MLIMGLFIVIMIFVIVCFIQFYIFKSDIKDWQKKKKIYNDKGLDFIDYYWIKLYSGFREYGVKDTVQLTLFKDRLIFKIDGDEKEVLFKDIQDYRIQTESQLIEKASLMKVACFGVLGLGMKGKEKEVNKEYVYIKAIYKGEVINIIFDIKIEKNEDFIQSIHKLMKEYRNINIVKNVVIK